MRNPQNNDMSEYNTATNLLLDDNDNIEDEMFVTFESESVQMPMTVSELSCESPSDDEEHEVAVFQDISDDEKNVIRRDYLANDLEARVRVVLIEEERLARRENEISEREYNSTPMTDYDTREEQLSRREYEIARRTNYLNLREGRVSQYEISIYNR
jgi:hypothetical protein